MDPLHFSIALFPLAIYLLVLSVVHLSRRPFLTTGVRDTAALGLAVAGFVVAGPMELFLPRYAAARFGPYVWVLLLAFYFLCLTLWVLLMRPRLVIYNIAADQLRSVLASVAVALDKEARWAGDSLSLPQLGVQLHLETQAVRCVQLLSAGSNQSYSGWRRLELGLGAALRQLPVRQGKRFGWAFAAAGIGLLCLITVRLAIDTLAVEQALRTILLP